MTARAIETVVRERLGLDPASLGPRAVERAVEARMRASGLTDPAVFAARLMTDPAERNALAADLVVSETWFFRGGRALFDHLAGFVAARGPAARVLSVPCSTGEEPYSLALALHDRGPLPYPVLIHAVDVSERVLARATAARYGASAFREGGPDVRPGAFRPADGTWELLPHLRRAVLFLPGNLTDPLFLADQRPYDLILCRNLFIYLTPEARGRALANIDRLLARDGRLCVTPAEADRLPPTRFVPDGAPDSGLYRRPDPGNAGTRAATDAPRTQRRRPAEPTPAPRVPDAPVPEPPDPGRLDDARRLADAGRLDDARAACEAMLRDRPADVDALALLGVVHLAAERPDAAVEAFRKALYLAPDHSETLAHLATLCARRGDHAQAAALRRRLARLVPPAPPEGS